MEFYSTVGKGALKMIILKFLHLFNHQWSMWWSPIGFDVPKYIKERTCVVCGLMQFRKEIDPKYGYIDLNKIAAGWDKED